MPLVIGPENIAQAYSSKGLKSSVSTKNKPETRDQNDQVSLAATGPIGDYRDAEDLDEKRVLQISASVTHKNSEVKISDRKLS